MKKTGISWKILGEGSFFGFLTMLVAEEPVMNWLMPFSGLLFLIHLICRCAADYDPASAQRFRKIGRPCRISAWVLISVATLVASAGQS